nr:MAG TPA: hypothetical protein [Bacteriophage sp.]
MISFEMFVFKWLICSVLDKKNTCIFLIFCVYL